MKPWMLLLLASGCSGVAAPRPGPKPVATAATTAVASTKPEPVTTCPEREAALETVAQRLRAGELERAHQVLSAAQAGCPDDPTMARQLADVALQQGRLKEVESLLVARPAHLDVDDLRERLAAARRDLIKGRALVARAAGADPQSARRLYDRALVAFEREQKAKPRLVFLAPADGKPRPPVKGKHALWPSLNQHGERGWTVTDGVGEPQRWYRGASARFLSEDVLRVGSKLVHLELGVTRQGWSGFEPQVDPGGQLVVQGGGTPKVWRLSDLSEVASIEHQLGANRARWLDTNRLVLWSSAGAVVFDVKKHAPTLKVQGLVAVSPTGRYLAQLELPPQNGRLRVVDLKTGRDAFAATVPFRPWSRALAFSPDERRLLYLPNDGTAHAFSIPGGGRRTVGKAKADAPELELRAAYLTNDGYVCANRGFHKYGTCENDVLFSLAGRPLLKKGPRQLKCLPGPDGMRVVSFPRGPLTDPSREVLPSGSRPGVAACNQALSRDAREAAWLEGKSADARLLHAVLVHFDPRTGRVLHKVPIDAPKQRILPDLSFDMGFADDKLRLQFDRQVFVLDTRSGTTSVAAQRSPFPSAAELWGAGDGQAWSPTMAWDLETLRGRALTTTPLPTKRYRVLGGTVNLMDGDREVARVTLYDATRALVQYPDGTLEPRGFAPKQLGCAFGDEVTRWEVCSHRLTPTQTYEARWRSFSQGRR